MKTHVHLWHMTGQNGTKCSWVCTACDAHQTTFDGKGN